jgi:hypothetical protein
MCQYHGAPSIQNGDLMIGEAADKFGITFALSNDIYILIVSLELHLDPKGYSVF